MRYILTTSLILAGLWGNSLAQSTPGSKDDTSKVCITTKLNVPFGTIASLEVEVYDGDLLQMKAYAGTYLLKIRSVNGKRMDDNLLLTFVDETETLANDNLTLYEETYSKTAKSLTMEQIDAMKEKYVGKKLTVMAYETGHFTGLPEDYFKYKPIRADSGFQFEHYLVVVSNLAN
jgi:hypothetical protein